LTNVLIFHLFYGLFENYFTTNLIIENLDGTVKIQLGSDEGGTLDEGRNFVLIIFWNEID